MKINIKFGLEGSLDVMADFSKTTLYEATPSGFVESFAVKGTLNVLSLLERRL